MDTPLYNGPKGIGQLFHQGVPSAKPVSGSTPTVRMTALSFLQTQVSPGELRFGLELTKHAVARATVVPSDGRRRLLSDDTLPSENKTHRA